MKAIPPAGISSAITDGVTDIQFAFQGHKTLRHIVVLESVTMMQYAFQDCDSLDEIVMYGHYDYGDAFGVEPNMSVKTIICFSEEPTIIGSAPNATLFVPEAAIQRYKDAIAEFPMRLEADGLPAIEYKDIRPLWELHSYESEDESVTAKIHDYITKLVSRELNQALRDNLTSLGSQQ